MVGYGGWTRESLVELLDRLVDSELAHGTVMLEAIEKGGFLGRARVLELSGRPRNGKLTGWSRPMKRIITTMKVEGLLLYDAVDPFVPMYDEDAERSALYGYSVPAPLVTLLFSGCS